MAEAEQADMGRESERVGDRKEAGGKQLRQVSEKKENRRENGRGANEGDGSVLYKRARVVATRAPSCTALACTAPPYLDRDLGRESSRGERERRSQRVREYKWLAGRER